MNDDTTATDIPTRAIHEAYLDMHRALKRYRQAKDSGTEAAIDDAHGDVQETVLTFYEMLRPHIKNNEAVNDYWDGKLPPYVGNEPPDPEEGKGVLQVQTHHQSVDWEEAPIDPEVSIEDLRDASLSQWHDHLNLNGHIRLTGVKPNQNGIFLSTQRYQLGLRELDGWDTEYRTRQTTIGGFLGSQQKQEKERVRIDIAKLRRAARELSDVAKETGYLPKDEIQPNDDALPI